MGFTLSPWLVWFLAGIAVMLAELAVPGFVILFFGLGCWGAAAIAVFAPEAYSAQVVVFIIVSIASLMTLRKVAMRVFVGRSEGPETEDFGNVPVGARITLDQDLEARTRGTGPLPRNPLGRHFRRTNPGRIRCRNHRSGQGQSVPSQDQGCLACLRFSHTKP